MEYCPFMGMDGCPEGYKAPLKKLMRHIKYFHCIGWDDNSGGGRKEITPYAR
jgi:hypothetical protein